LARISIFHPGVILCDATTRNDCFIPSSPVSFNLSQFTA
jgi:hypothetical protein